MPSSLSSALNVPLAEFQQKLDAALQQDEGASETFVGVRANGQRWLLPLTALEEVGMVQQVARLGTMPHAVVGLANFRGHPRTLVDTPLLLGGPATSDQGSVWAMILREAELGVALLWPDVAGLFPHHLFSDQQPASDPWVNALRRDESGEVWEELNVEALLAHLRQGTTMREPV